MTTVDKIQWLVKPYKHLDESWRVKGQCFGSLSPSFFPPRGDTMHTRWAKSRCAECEVQPECLNFATWEDPQPDGIYGGVNSRFRQQLRNGDRTLLDVVAHLAPYRKGGRRYLPITELPG